VDEPVVECSITTPDYFEEIIGPFLEKEGKFGAALF
jgi:hypothetical protein